MLKTMMMIACLAMFLMASSSNAETTFTRYSGNDNNNTEFLGDLEDLGYEFWAKNGDDSSSNDFVLEGNGKQGTWDAGSQVIVGVAIKAGNEFVFVNYGKDNGKTSDSWCTDAGCTIDGLTPYSIVNKNGIAKELSHLTLYTAPVPEASTLAMMFIGSGAIAFARRRKFSKK